MSAQFDPIPRDLSEAFHEVVRQFSDWRPPEPEREVSVKQRPYTMSEVCGLADGFAELMPDEVFDQLLSYMDARHLELRGELAKDRSYANGARSLLKLINDRKEYWRRLYS